MEIKPKSPDPLTALAFLEQSANNNSHQQHR
jgi:hypothetical protein